MCSQCTRILGKAAFQLDEQAQAEAAYRKAIGINPDALLAWKGLAEIYGSTTSNLAGVLEANEKLVRTFFACILPCMQGMPVTALLRFLPQQLILHARR